MHFAHSKPEVLRRTNSEDIKIVWECICSSKVQKQNATFDKLIKSVSKETNLNDESSKRLIQNVESDGLIERNSNQSSKGVNIAYSNAEYFTQPDFAKQYKKGDKDWYCFICHLAGEVISCFECFRSFHVNCYKDQNQNKQSYRQSNRYNKNSDKFVCYTCEAENDSDENFSRKQIRKLLDFATHFIRKKSSWKDMLSIGFRNEIVKNEYLVYRYCDLDLIQAKIHDGRYSYLTELVNDAENFVHNVCILHGIYSDKADQARVLLREIKDEINEVQLCPDCYINAKAKLAEWITKPCQPSHKLIWAKQPGGQYFWPAKLLLEKSDGFEVRFFGGNHERSFIKKSDTKSFQFRPDEIEVKLGSGFDRAWIEVKKLKEKIEQGYYTHSSGESDLPDMEDNYSDEMYLTERRAKGLSLLDHQNLANGSSYSLLSSLSSRRSSALDRSRKNVNASGLSSPNPNGKVVPASKITLKSITAGSKRRKNSRGSGLVGSGGPVAKRMLTSTSNRDKMSYKNRPPGRPSSNMMVSVNKRQSFGDDRDSDDSDSDSTINSDDNVSENSSSSVNMQSLNFKFSPKKSILRSPGVSAKSLRQNRKPSAKLSQLSATRYTSLSDRIKNDLSSTESSEFDPKDEHRTNPSNSTSTRKKGKKSSIAADIQSKSQYSINNKYQQRRRSPITSMFSSKQHDIVNQNPRTSSRRGVISDKQTGMAANRKSRGRGASRNTGPDNNIDARKRNSGSSSISEDSNDEEEEDDDDDDDDDNDSPQSNSYHSARNISNSRNIGGPNASNNLSNPSANNRYVNRLHPGSMNNVGSTTGMKMKHQVKRREYSSDSNSSTEHCISPDDSSYTNTTTTTSNARHPPQQQLPQHRKQLSIQPPGSSTPNMASPGQRMSYNPGASNNSGVGGGMGQSGAASTSSQQSVNNGVNNPAGPNATVTTVAVYTSSLVPITSTTPMSQQPSAAPISAPPVGPSTPGGSSAITLQQGTPHRQRMNSGYSQMFQQQPVKRMVHKCVATTLPACNCPEKFEKKFEEEKIRTQKEQQTLLTELEKKLRTEFEDAKAEEIKRVSAEIRTQMQELINKEKSAGQEALMLAEAKHNEAITNTKRRQWCRNCLKEAIYHCCWNTSYCSIQCQQEHWQKEHKRVCRRKR